MPDIRKLKLLLFTDEPVAAMGFAEIMAEDGNFMVLPAINDPGVLLDAVKSNAPDILILDSIPELTLDVLGRVQGERLSVKTVLWVRAISPEVTHRVMTMGVSGILRKNLPSHMMVRCFQKIADGELWFENTMMGNYMRAKTINLTLREGQLVTLLAQGMKNKEIATALYLSEGTVKVYLSRLFQKTGAKDRFELALHGVKNLALESKALHDSRSPQRDSAQKSYIRYLVMNQAKTSTSETDRSLAA
jgi:DNA-binding NarL/FixJ family response regulator